jgi:hypothetical protein
MKARIDHLVVAARTLDEGVQWCEATLGVTPGPGGTHPLMGTHNRLLPLGGEAFAPCYLEIIAIDPKQRPTRGGHMHRWFDLDDPALQQGLARHGPQLVHFAARVPDAHAAVQALEATPTHIARGRVIEAARDTPAGRLAWQITVRDDGQRLFYGLLPTLIQWGAVHPTDSMADAGLRLVDLRLTHPRAPVLAAALQVIGLAEVTIDAGPPNLVATIDTPRGRIALESKGL